MAKKGTPQYQAWLAKFQAKVNTPEMKALKSAKGRAAFQKRQAAKQPEASE